MSMTPRSRRAFLCGLAGVGVAGLTAACSGDPAPAQRSRPSSFVQVPTAVGTPARPGNLSGTLSIAYADELGKKPAYVNKTATELQRLYPNVTVSIQQSRLGGSEFFDQLLPSLSAEDAPDIIHVGGDRLGELADAGLVTPLDEYLQEWPDWRYYSPTVRDGVTYQGQVWAIPYGLDTRFLYFRRDIFEQVGLGADWTPKNVADILSAAARVKSLRPEVMPYALYAGPNGGTGTANHGFVPLVYAYGGSLKDPRGNWIGDSQAIRKAFGFYATAFQSERVASSELLTMPRSWVAMRERLGDGRLAMLFEGGWVYGGWADKDRSGTAKNIGYLLFPTETEGPSFTVGGSGTCWYITSASRNKRLAWEFIAAWNNTETVGRLNAEDPHPVARVDAVRVPEYRSESFLVDSTESLRRAHFIPPDADYGRVIGAMHSVTAAVAGGEITPDDGARRYAGELRQVVGASNVVVLN